MSMPIFAVPLLNTAISVAAPAPGAAETPGYVPATPPVQLPGVSQAPPVVPDHVEVVCAKTGAAVAKRIRATGQMGRVRRDMVASKGIDGVKLAPRYGIA